MDSMNIFCGAELAFDSTYFPTKRSRTVRINTDAPVQTLVSTEVPQLAGSFAFPEGEGGLENRFILWRSDGTNLYLDEFSTERDLQESSLTINFSQSLIVPGTTLFYYKHVLILVVPTQSGLHTFNINLAGDGERIMINRSVLAKFPSDADLSFFHAFHHLKTSGICTKADIGMSSGGLIVAAMCLADKQLIRIALQVEQNVQYMRGDELLLQGNNMFNRIFKGQSAWSDTWDMTVANTCAGGLVIYSIHQDGMLRAWDGNSSSSLFCVAIWKFFGEESQSSIMDIALRTISLKKEHSTLLILRAQIGEYNRFIALDCSNNTPTLRFSQQIESKFIVDFMCAPDVNTGNYCLWTIVSESFNESQEDAFFQPYVLKKCAFSLDQTVDPIWEEVQAATAQNSVHSTLFNFSEIDAVTCKSTTPSVEYNDWYALTCFVDDFIGSGHFKELYLSREDGSVLLKFNALKNEKMKGASDKFWNDLLRCCNQLQEADLQPLSFLYSSSLGLIGVIQVCRFTVYIPPDEFMRSICQPSNKVVKSFFELVEPFLRAENALNSMEASKTLETVSANTEEELCRVIRAFAEHRPVDVANHLADTRSEYLSSTFTTGMLGMALRNRVIGRLRLADIMNKLISIVPQILAISTEARTASGTRLDLVINAYHSAITQIISYYTIMWIALSVRIIRPESTTLILPRFLANAKFFDALKNYCELKDPFISELAHALKFLHAISFSGLNDPEAAWKAFEEIAHGVATGDDALNNLLITLQPQSDSTGKHSLVEYYHKIMLLFKSHGHTKYVIAAGEKAVQHSKENDPLLVEIFTTLFTHHLDEESYREAIRTLLMNPSRERQSVCLRELLNHLLEQGQTKTLTYLSFEHLTDTVVEILETRCRADAMTNPHTDTYDVVFAFHVSRFDFDKAARVLYEQTQRLKQEIQTRELLEKRCRVLATVYQTLGIAESGRDTINFDVDLGRKHIDEDGYNMDYEMYNSEDLQIADIDEPTTSQRSGYRSAVKTKSIILTRKDIAQELVKAEARLGLLDVQELTVPPLESEDILRESLKHKRYDMAWVIVQEFGLQPYDLLEAVTKDAILLDYQHYATDKDQEWAMFNYQFMKNTKGKNTTHWKVVTSYVDLALQYWPHDVRILRTIAYVFLRHCMKIPTWLERKYKNANFGDFMRTLMDFGELEDAFRLLLPEIDLATTKITAGTMDFTLPFTHIDGLLELAGKVTDKALPIEETHGKLRKLGELYASIQKTASFN
ncbi:nucleoporin domain-containing protein [Ditylenchus destructor]|nr:nucleoporin domain-containing protein [Ditylenchus destructor]